MPELPEVESTRRALAPLLTGRRISSVRTTARSYFFLTAPATLRKRLPGRFVTGLTRHGKYLQAGLDDGGTLLLHLGMTGELFAVEDASRFRPDRHVHLRLRFEDGGPEVVFRDVRKFGKVLLLPRGGSDHRLEKLGPDALRASGDELHEAARGRRIPIKSLLLDQSVLAGVGNIYADEGLFLAKVRPTRTSRRVSLAESKAIVAACRHVMQRSIRRGGEALWRDVKVYGRAAEPCLVCGTSIRRVVLGQRAAHFCPSCQK